MPLRMLVYVTESFRKLIAHKDLFRYKRLMLPEPRFTVFYTGREKMPAVEVMKLSDAYQVGSSGKLDPPQLELSCTVYNLNNEDIKRKFEATESISGYMAFVDRVKENLRTTEDPKDGRKIVAEAVDHCISRGILVDFFTKHREVIINMTELDMTIEKRLEYQKLEAEEEIQAERAKTVAAQKEAETERLRAEKAEAELAELKKKLGTMS